MDAVPILAIRMLHVDPILMALTLVFVLEITMEALANTVNNSKILI